MLVTPTASITNNCIYPVLIVPAMNNFPFNWYQERRERGIYGNLNMSPLQNKAQLCCSMLGTCLQTGIKTPTRLVERKGFCLVNKGVQCQANFAYLDMCWMCVMMVGELFDSCPVYTIPPLLQYVGTTGKGHSTTYLIL